MRGFHPRMIPSLTLLSLEGDPVCGLDEEDVIRVRVEQRRLVPAESEIADWIGIGSVLLPHEKQRRSRMIFPAEHCIPAQGAEIEIRIEESDRLRRAASISIDRVAPAAIDNRGLEI